MGFLNTIWNFWKRIKIKIFKLPAGSGKFRCRVVSLFEWHFKAFRAHCRMLSQLQIVLKWRLTRLGWRLELWKTIFRWGLVFISKHCELVSWCSQYSSTPQENCWSLWQQSNISFRACLRFWDCFYACGLYWIFHIIIWCLLHYAHCIQFHFM